MGHGRSSGARARIPLAMLKDHTNPRSMERVYALAAAYRGGERIPAIPVRFNKHGQLLLEGDGNHRLAAARLAGVSHVDVIVDARNGPRLRKFAAL